MAADRVADDGVVRSAYRWVGALALVLTVGVALLVLGGVLGRPVLADRLGPAPMTPVDGAAARVVRVTDGDTLRVSVDGRVERLRIIGIDAPEVREDECQAQESTALMELLVADGQVRIAADDTQAERDVYGRILRHVWLADGRSVALEMLTAGLAREYTYAAPYAGVAEHRAAEDEARAAGRGVWGEVCAGRTSAPPP